MASLRTLTLMCSLMVGSFLSTPVVARYAPHRGRIGQRGRPSINTRSMSQYFKKYAEMQQAAYKAAQEQAVLDEQARLKKKQDGIDKRRERRELEKQHAIEWAEKQKAKHEQMLKGTESKPAWTKAGATDSKSGAAKADDKSKATPVEKPADKPAIQTATTGPVKSAAKPVVKTKK